MKLKRNVERYIGETISKGKEYAWRITVAAVVLLGAVLILRPLVSLISNSIEIRQLNKEKALYKASIQRDSLILENLKNDEFLERYAREKYFMQGKGEQVFIIE